jgi:hypothetical protein
MPSLKSIKQDAIDILLANHAIAWSDVPISEGEIAAERLWLTTGNTARMLETIGKNIVRNAHSSKKTIRWARDEDEYIPDVNSGIYATLLPQELDIISPEMFHSASIQTYSHKLIREFPECSKYATVASSEYSALKPWQSNQVQTIFKSWFPNCTFKRIIDATAHIGADTINLSNLYPNALIDAYELHLDAFVALHTNIYNFNKLDRIRTHWRDITSWTPYEAIDLVYADPPWGGVTYDRSKELELFFQQEDAPPLAHRNVNHVIDQWLSNKNIKNVVMKIPHNFSKKYLESKYAVSEMPVYNRAGRVAYTLIHVTHTPIQLPSSVQQVFHSASVPSAPNPSTLTPSLSTLTPNPSTLAPSVQRLFAAQPPVNPWLQKGPIQSNAMPKVMPNAMPKVIPNPIPKNVSPHKNTIKTIIVRNLPRDITSQELITIFKVYGNIVNVFIPVNRDKQSPYFGIIKGFALIKYSNADEAYKAFSIETSMHKRTIRTKQINTDLANEDR